MYYLFSNINPLHLLYLFYGASFLFLGASISAKEMRGSDLRLADSLWLLATFGFVHGAREWLELGPLIEVNRLSYPQLFFAKSLATLLDLASFLFLLRFGLSLLEGLGDGRRVRWAKAMTIPLILGWVGVIIKILWQDPLSMQSLFVADQATRFAFGFFGATVTAYGLIANAREVRLLSPAAARKVSLTGISFGFYALFTVYNQGYSWVPALPVPIELLRATAAFSITFFIVTALSIFDIEMRKKMEQQARRLVMAEKLTSLGQLAAGIAHEINNPLTNASLGIERLKSRFEGDGGDPEIVSRLTAVEKNIDRASTIAQELLQFSRQRETDFAPLRINHVIDGALTLMHYKLRDVEVKEQLSPSLPAIMGDAGKLQQVLINILSNGVEAMPKGGTITISTASIHDMVQVKVSDTGTGMDADDLSRAFDPFFTTKEVGSGTGLGLPICYGIIRQHKGSIEMTSTTGIGTTVDIRLPRGGGK